MKYHFTLTGQTPLLMHQDSVELSDSVDAWIAEGNNKKNSKAGDDRFPAWKWQTYCYRDGTHLTIPADNLMTCLRKAGAQITLKGKTTFKSQTQSALLIEEEFLDFFVDGNKIPFKKIDSLREKPFLEQWDDVQKLGFKLWMKRATVGQGKHVRVRPRFEKWSVCGVVEVLDDTLITPAILTELFQRAGRLGLGDWRPSSPKAPGPFGIFLASVKAC